jgi:hypothetical protein
VSSVPRNFYTNNELMLHRAMTAAVGLRLHSFYSSTSHMAVPERFKRLLKKLDETDARTAGEDAREHE